MVTVETVDIGSYRNRIGQTGMAHKKKPNIKILYIAHTILKIIGALLAFIYCIIMIHTFFFCRMAIVVENRQCQLEYVKLCYMQDIHQFYGTDSQLHPNLN